MTETEFSGALDLSGADTKGFEAVPSGTYDCELFEWGMKATKGGVNDDGTPKKMPEGTPMVNLQFRCIEEPYENRRFFNAFVIPPESYDPEKRAKMLGALVRFFVAIGMEESEVKNKKFKMAEALDNLVGDPLRVTVKKKPKYGTDPKDEEFDNEVVGFKAINTESGPTGKLL